MLRVAIRLRDGPAFREHRLRTGDPGLDGRDRDPCGGLPQVLGYPAYQVKYNIVNVLFLAQITKKQAHLRGGGGGGGGHAKRTPGTVVNKL